MQFPFIFLSHLLFHLIFFELKCSTEVFVSTLIYIVRRFYLLAVLYPPRVRLCAFAYDWPYFMIVLIQYYW